MRTQTDCSELLLSRCTKHISDIFNSNFAFVLEDAFWPVMINNTNSVLNPSI